MGAAAVPISVLLVEDSAVDAQLVADSLASARPPGYAVRHTGRLSDALAALGRDSFDVVVLDLGLPDACGLEALTKLRACAPGAAFVVRTGSDDERAAITAIEAGAQDYLVKGSRSAADELNRSISYALARRQAEDTQRRLAAIVESSNDAILSTDQGGLITSWNPGAERLYGYTAQEAIGQPTAILIPPAQTDDFDIVARVLDGERIEHYETMRRRLDGSLVMVSLTISPITDRLGAVVGCSGIAHDITERKLMEDELRLSREQALDASRSKSEFVATMSHELRTPLNGVIGLTQLLHDTALDARQRRYVDGLETSGDALLAVISDVLDFSTVEAGRLHLDRTHFVLAGAVEEATQMLSRQAHEKGLEINHWVDRELPATVDGDRARLRQILLNLLSNAVKFTPAGEITLRVTSAGKDLVRFSVTDTGVGIDKEHAAHLFDAFTQADMSTTREYGGTGLGLAIASRLVALMGGEINAESRDEGGSVFSFTALLPQVAAVAPDPAPRPDLRFRKTLIVDDNATNRIILTHHLRSWGLSCESFDQPKLALSALEQAASEGQPFELGVLDFNMPQMDGIELVRQIRSQPALAALRLVILSSAPLEHVHAEHLDVASVLTKPAPTAAIYDAISAALTPARVTFDDGLSVLLAEDNSINMTVAEGLLTSMGLQPAFAVNGHEAVDMAARKEYDIIFMDCQMPGLDGFAATREIRGAEHGRHVPIVAITACSMPGDRERCLAAGMDDYLSKPLRREDLEAVIERLLHADSA
jgi:PAS domain S-box-containing protein